MLRARTIGHRVVSVNKTGTEVFVRFLEWRGASISWSDSSGAWRSPWSTWSSWRMRDYIGSPTPRMNPDCRTVDSVRQLTELLLHALHVLHGETSPARNGSWASPWSAWRTWREDVWEEESQSASS